MHPIMQLLTRPAPAAAQTRFDFDTPAGIRAVADHMENLSGEPTPGQSVTFGHLCIRNHPAALFQAAAMLRSRAPEAGLKRRGLWQTPRLHAPADARAEAVRFYGSEVAALAGIRRTLAAQREDMDPAAVKRCERAAALLEGGHWLMPVHPYRPKKSKAPAPEVTQWQVKGTEAQSLSDALGRNAQQYTWTALTLDAEQVATLRGLGFILTGGPATP